LSYGGNTLAACPMLIGKTRMQFSGIGKADDWVVVLVSALYGASKAANAG